MATYKITNLASGLCLNIEGDNLTALYNNQNVTVWADSGTNEQRWVIDDLGGSTTVRSAIDESYGLNIYTTTYNCDVYPIAGNANDSAVTFEWVSGKGYKVRLTNYSTLYLTAAGSTNGSNVSWAADKGTDYQYWTLTEAEEEPDTPTVPDIEAWSWFSSNGSATSAQTKNAYYAITKADGYTVGDFSYKVWNDLCDKVKECIDRAGSSWWTVMGPNGATTPTYANTRMSASDKELTADRLNAVRGNVGGRVSTGISPVYPGDKVYGWYFETIADCLNTWIANLNA